MSRAHVTAKTPEHSQELQEGRGAQPGGDLHPATGSLFKRRGVQSKPNSMSSWSPASDTAGSSGFMLDCTPPLSVLVSNEERR